MTHRTPRIVVPRPPDPLQSQIEAVKALKLKARVKTAPVRRITPEALLRRLTGFSEGLV